MLDSDVAESLLDHYDTYQYASREHVVLHLAWRTMLRRGAIRAIDLDDYHPRDEYLEIRHHPEANTPLKNQHEGE
ncbi:hypothetical protein [Haloplanus salilacus]|uniref:hypothetical protein n=1 Tax=Haloplanus salilacus TaxID=2949994 RepID=UPI0030CC37D9